MTIKGFVADDHDNDRAMCNLIVCLPAPTF